jgi:hypothetical protein
MNLTLAVGRHFADNATLTRDDGNVMSGKAQGRFTGYMLQRSTGAPGRATAEGQFLGHG